MTVQPNAAPPGRRIHALIGGLSNGKQEGDRGMLHPFKRIAPLFLLIGVLASCRSPHLLYQTSPDVQTLMKKQVAYPTTRFIVLSDLHYFDPELGTNEQAFKDRLDEDRKLLAESSELIVAAIDEIGKQTADFVLICGDLTKDGEERNHRLLAEKLTGIVKAGKGLFVIPGNHDVLNGKSVAFKGNQANRIETVTPDEFAAIYADFGYTASLDRDSLTLSYVAEPVPGLLLLALDGSLWRFNKPGKHANMGAAFSTHTLQWIENHLIRAKHEEKSVIVAIHHGVLEHYPGNDRFYPEYLVDNHRSLAEMLASYDVKLVFSGHFHAQDITRKAFGEAKQAIYDIETGSLVTAPCAYRIVELTAEQNAVIQSRFIDTIPSHPNDFKTHRDRHVLERSTSMVEHKLRGYRVSEKDTQHLSSQIATALVSHLRGDEVKPRTTIDADGVGLWGRIVLSFKRELIVGWYSDLPPADSHITINLKDGGYENN